VAVAFDDTPRKRRADDLERRIASSCAGTAYLASLNIRLDPMRFPKEDVVEQYPKTIANQDVV
jgi:hypothetical protein